MKEILKFLITAIALLVPSRAQQNIPPFRTPYGDFTTGIKLNGSYGSPGQCPISNGVGTIWQSCGSGGGGAGNAHPPLSSIQIAGPASFLDSDPLITINKTTHSVNVGGPITGPKVNVFTNGLTTGWNWDWTTPGTALASLGPIPASQIAGSIANYGASTSSTDNTAAINAAIAAVEAAGGGTVFIPCGTWNLTSPADSSNYAALALYTGNTPVILKGEYQGCAILQYNGTTNIQAVIQLAYQKPSGALTPPANYVTQSGLENLVVRGNSHVQDSIDLLRLARSTFRNLVLGSVANSCAYMIDGVNFTYDNVKCSQSAVPNWSVQPVNGLVFDATSISDASTTGTIISPVVEGVSGIGLWLKGLQATAFTACQISENAIDYQDSSMSTSNTFNSCLFEGVTATGAGTPAGDFNLSSAYNTFISTTFSGNAFNVGGNNNVFVNGIETANTAAITGVHNVFNNTGLTGIPTATSDTQFQGVYQVNLASGAQDYPEWVQIPELLSSRGQLGDPVHIATGTWAWISSAQPHKIFLDPYAGSYLSGTWAAKLSGRWFDASAGWGAVPEEIELSNSSNTVSFLGQTVTVSIIGGYLQFSTSSTHQLLFTGRIEFYPNNAAYGLGTTALTIGSGAAMTGNQGNGANIVHATGTISASRLMASDANGNATDSGILINNVMRYCGTVGFSASTTSNTIPCAWVTSTSHCTATWIYANAGGALGTMPGAGTIGLMAATANSDTATVACSAN